MILNSENRSVQIKILRRSYPESTDFDDLNWLEAKVEIDVPGFKGLYGTNFRTSDFERFQKQLHELKINVLKEIEFTTMEEGLYLKGIFDETGHIGWKGIAKSLVGDCCLIFKIWTDYASIDDLLEQIHEILNEFPVIK